MGQGNYGKVYARIFNDTTLTKEARILYGCLALRADSKSRECYPSVDTIIKESGLCKTTVYKCMRELQDRGIVEKKSRLVNNLKIGVTYKLNDTS